ncbi:I78 family peptidase inhibitor [Acinetobacter schindleri]|uniref:I78 family peptidase inhibitor n=1 Tax=Acinetobacter schindleri TaxID=108981 RepID=UPI002899EF79|nr:I78 family peptidase inhibitor [Acinetobacter schindleri]
MKAIYSLPLALTIAALTACASTSNTIQQPEIIKKCTAEGAAKLVQMKFSSETDIKSKTNSEVVRLVAPGQPITKDYYPGRVTVVVDPQTKIILQAFCG